MRNEFPKPVRRDAFMRAGGNCEGILEDGNRCNCRLTVGKMTYDHIIPDWMGGEPVLSNCQVLCDPCNKAKTRKDQRDIGKTRRIRDRHLGIRDPHKRPLPGSRNSNIKKKMDGTVVYRDTGLPVR